MNNKDSSDPLAALLADVSPFAPGSGRSEISDGGDLFLEFLFLLD